MSTVPHKGIVHPKIAWITNEIPGDLSELDVFTRKRIFSIPLWVDTLYAVTVHIDSFFTNTDFNSTRCINNVNGSLILNLQLYKTRTLIFMLVCYLRLTKTRWRCAMDKSHTD